MHTFYRLPTYADYCLDSEHVSNLDYGGIACLTFASSVPGELPPPPGAFFGREELIDRIVRFAENLRPIAITGPEGIGKTSIALTVLHDDRIKQRFGQDRRFIRCEGFPASPAHFLRQLSAAVGAGIENPEDICSLRPFLSSKEMLIVLDNAGSILNPQWSDGEEYFTIVETLTKFDNLCLCITSTIPAVPPECKILGIPALFMEAAQDTFYHTYKSGERSNQIDDILKQLDYYPLFIALLATVAQTNKWRIDLLTMEWERQHTRLPGSLATTIEVSLTSPMFRELGDHARELLQVVAFFPQGVNEDNIDWLLSTFPDVLNVLNTFSALSLTYRNDRFITMSEPLRNHLRPKDPASRPLLVKIKECYFVRLSGDVLSGEPGSEEARWIASEDANVEHLLDVFTTVDASSTSVWDACSKFMAQLLRHKSRLTTLGPKIQALPDDHPSKAECLWHLSRLFDSLGDLAQSKVLLRCALQLCRRQGGDYQIALTLRSLSDTNRGIHLIEEGIQQAEEASAIFEQLGDAVEQAGCLISLAKSLRLNKQLDAAKDAALRALDLLRDKEGARLWICRGYSVLGEIYRYKGKTNEAVHHYKAALQIADLLNMGAGQFWIHIALMALFYDQHKLGNAQSHIERAKLYAVDNKYFLARAMYMQALIWVKQYRIEEARSEASHALDAFRRLQVWEDIMFTRQLLGQIDPQGIGCPGHVPWIG